MNKREIWEAKQKEMKKDYNSYLASNIWKAKSRRWINETEYCEICGNQEKNTPAGRFTCHHKHYKTFGNEGRKDVQVLCWSCHQKIHKKINWIDYRAKLFKSRNTIQKDLRWMEISKELGLNFP